MKKKLLKYKEPLFSVRSQKEIVVLHRFPNGNLVVAHKNGNRALRTVDKYGYNTDPRLPYVQVVTNEGPCTVEYIALYPNGNVYRKECCPIRDSSYGVENLIQIKITRQGDKIINKEFV